MRVWQSLVFLLFFFLDIVVFVAFVHAAQLERFHADDFILGSTFITGDNVALVQFIYFNI
ncbi:MAG TPA: hypothetical protein VMV57_04225 [Terracidiphilus sp.]|nr:hypothetical protein [Terracidiphilus sp.]